MIMSRRLHDCIHLGQRDIGLDTINESAKPLARVLERQGWTVLKTLIAGQQGGRDETSDVGLLANIHSQIQGFMRQDWKQLSIWERWCCVSHKRVSFRITRVPDQSRGGWRSGTPWVCLYQLRTRSMAFNLVSGVPTRPPGFFQESSSKAFAGFCGIVASRERPHCASPLLIVHMFFRKIKRCSEMLSEAIGIFSRVPA